MINFGLSGNKIERGVVFEDECIIVMNKHDLENICILAIEGYGEEDLSRNDSSAAGGDSINTNDNKKDTNNIDGGVLFRGARPWTDSVGGATVCCNQCCSVLGYASIEDPDSCRLLKHRLCAKKSVTTNNNNSNNNSNMHNDNDVELRSMTTDSFLNNTCSSFIAKELVRYAESQAVFTFAIFNSDSSNQILLLKLLSWNTFMRTMKKKRGDDIINQHNTLKFDRIAKVIYEEIHDLNGHLDINNKNDITDPMNFSWGGFDLCCPPPGIVKSTKMDDTKKYMQNFTPDSNNASVQIYLPEDEWVQLRDALITGSTLFPNDISAATVQLKLGSEESKRKKAVLSLLRLPHST